MELPVYTYVVIFLFGLCFGSFFNVAIYRWPHEDPKEREWIKTPSHCPKCGTRIKWYDNIPLFSYILLRGRCRHCQQSIHWRYPLVELGTALLWLLTAWLTTHYGLSNVPLESITIWHVLFVIAFASLYLLTFVIDLNTSLIPDQITIAHFLLAWAFMWVCHGATISPGWQSSLIGMFVLSSFFLLFYFFRGMGLGDVLLAIGFGVIFGWKLVIVAGFAGIMLGGLVAIIIIAVLTAKGKYKMGLPIPFGPFLAIGAYICLFFGTTLLDWYLGFFPKLSTALAGL